MQIRIAGLAHDSIVDGEGIRLTVFTQGCPHACHGCHNPETHDPNGGKLVDVDEIIGMLDNHKRRLNVWCYTGWTWEEIMRMPCLRGMLAYIDVLVDGRYIHSKRTLGLKWRGSENQRVINVADSLFAGRIIKREDADATD